MRGLTVALMLVLLTGIYRPVHAQQRAVSFNMPYLESFQTTEAGEDEIYLIVTGRWRSTGETFSYRFPNASGHWDMNDREGDPPVLNQHLLKLTLNEGDAVDLVVMVMEEDGGTVNEWVDIAASVGGALSKTAGTILGAISKLIPTITDTDDFIGAFSVRIENVDGSIRAQFTPRDRAYNYGDPMLYWKSYRIDMNGDGSDYHSLFSVDDGTVVSSMSERIPPRPAPPPAPAPGARSQKERCPRC
jgi:hypothetical protein